MLDAETEAKRSGRLLIERRNRPYENWAIDLDVSPDDSQAALQITGSSNDRAESDATNLLLWNIHAHEELHGTEGVAFVTALACELRSVDLCRINIIPLRLYLLYK